MEASQHALTAKSSDDIDSLQKTKVELENQVRSLEMNLQEKAEVCIYRCHTYLVQLVTPHRSVPDWKTN